MPIKIEEKREQKDSLSKEANRTLLKIGKRMPRGVDVEEITDDSSVLELMNSGLIKIQKMGKMKRKEKFQTFVLKHPGMEKYLSLTNK